jgi:hypothetical protein
MVASPKNKAEASLRYWKASQAWHLGVNASSFTQESFINEVKMLCTDNGRVGKNADILLDDMIHDRPKKKESTNA